MNWRHLAAKIRRTFDRVKSDTNYFLFVCLNLVEYLKRIFITSRL